MDIIGTIKALFSGERVSQSDTLMLALLALALYICIRWLMKRKSADK